jgi:hypothetical protein
VTVTGIASTRYLSPHSARLLSSSSRCWSRPTRHHCRYRGPYHSHTRSLSSSDQLNRIEVKWCYEQTTATKSVSECASARVSAVWECGRLHCPNIYNIMYNVYILRQKKTKKVFAKGCYYQFQAYSCTCR